MKKPALILVILWVASTACLQPQVPPPRQPHPVAERPVEPESLGSSLAFDQAYCTSTLEMVQSSWERFLDEKIAEGMSLEEVDEAMQDNYRDRIITWHGQEGAFTVYYLVDDFFQIHVDMQRLDGVLGTKLKKRDLWLRFPKPGGVALIPTYLEGEFELPGDP